ncbi:MAG: hypothetical protein QXI19_14120, partial [Candidatus Caldarchaeum sp.]
MAIPYVLSHFTPGRVKIRSLHLKYADYDEGALRAHLENGDGVRSVRVNKKTGSLTIEYDPRLYDPNLAFSFFADLTPQCLVETLGYQKKNSGANKEGGEGRALRWFMASTLGLVPFVLRAAIPGWVLSSLTIVLAYPI